MKKYFIYSDNILNKLINDPKSTPTVPPIVASERIEVNYVSLTDNATIDQSVNN